MHFLALWMICGRRRGRVGGSRVGGVVSCLGVRGRGERVGTGREGVREMG